MNSALVIGIPLATSIASGVACWILSSRREKNRGEERFRRAEAKLHTALGRISELERQALDSRGRGEGLSDADLAAQLRAIRGSIRELTEVQRDGEGGDDLAAQLIARFGEMREQMTRDLALLKAVVESTAEKAEAPVRDAESLRELVRDAVSQSNGDNASIHERLDRLVATLTNQAAGLDELRWKVAPKRHPRWLESESEDQAEAGE